MNLARAAWVLLLLFVFTIPWEKSVWVPGVGTLTRLLGIFAFVAAVAHAWRRRSVRTPNLALVLAALFVIWSALTWFWSLDPAATSARALTFVQLFAMAVLIWDQCRKEHRDVQLMAAYVLGSLVASAYTIVRYMANVQTYYRRYAAGGFDPNDLGVTVALAIPFALYLSRSERGALVWLYRAAVALCCAAVLLTASRTAMIAVYAAFGFVVFTWHDSPRAHRIASVILFVFLLTGTFRIAPAASRERIATLPAELTQGTLHNRSRIWKAGLRALKQHPIVGVGSGAYPDAVKPWLGVPGIPGHEYVAHNTFLSVLVETGLVGFVLFTVLLTVIAIFVWVLSGAERALWAVMLFIWAVGVSTLTWEHRKPTWLLFALIQTAWARAFSSKAS